MHVKSATSIGFSILFFFFFCLCILCGTTTAQVHCDHKALAKTITGYCINSQVPNGRCCIAMLNVIERGYNMPCICHLIKDGIKVEKMIKFYYHCGGKTTSVDQLISHCGGKHLLPLSFFR